MVLTIIYALLQLLTGMGIMLVSMHLLTSNLESLGGNKIKAMFQKISKSNLAGVGIGTATTAIVQSSGLVSVITIGFVNAGLMSLRQAAMVIFGANIGTTVTAQIVALGLLGSGTIEMTIIFGSLAGIGAFILLFSKKEGVKKIGGFITGFGMLFAGLDIMTASMGGLAKSPFIVSFLYSIQNPALLLLVGILLTALLQSSSAMTSLTIAMIFGGLLNLSQGIYLTYGSNIGTCIVAIIACIGANANAKRTALIHLLFNVFGVVLFITIDFIFSFFGFSFAKILQLMFPNVPSTQLAMMHTIFNVVSVMVMFPFAGLLVKLTEKMLPDKRYKKVEDDLPKLKYIQEMLLVTPPIAVEQVKNEILYMSEIAIRNFNRSMDAIIKLDFSEKNKFLRDEELLDFMNREIIKYLVKLSRAQNNDEDAKFMGTMHHVVSDLERVGDYSKNIFEYAEKLFAGENFFSQEALHEVYVLRETINSLYKATLNIFKYNDLTGMENVTELENSVDDFVKRMGDSHISRLGSGTCTPDTGAIYLSLSNDAERIADHIFNIAKGVQSYAV